MIRLIKTILWAVATFAVKARIFMQRNVSGIIDAIQIIKEGISDPKLDVLVLLTDSKVDDNLLRAIRNVMGLLVPKVKKLKDNSKALELFVEELRNMPKELRDAILFKTASLTLKDLQGISSSQADTLTQLAFAMKKDRDLNI